MAGRLFPDALPIDLIVNGKPMNKKSKLSVDTTLANAAVNATKTPVKVDTAPAEKVDIAAAPEYNARILRACEFCTT